MGPGAAASIAAMSGELSTLVDGLAFPEGPRWHDARLWFSDMHFHRVVAVDMRGNTETIAEVPQRPSGLGWLPDGRLLVVSMTDRKLLRLDPGAGRRDLGGLTEQCGGAAGARGDAAHPCVHAGLRLHTARSRAGASSSRRSSFRRGFP